VVSIDIAELAAKNALGVDAGGAIVRNLTEFPLQLYGYNGVVRGGVQIGMADASYVHPSHCYSCSHFEFTDVIENRG
jgi:hypothetical protein